MLVAPARLPNFSEDQCSARSGTGSKPLSQAHKVCTLGPTLGLGSRQMPRQGPFPFLPVITGVGPTGTLFAVCRAWSEMQM